MGLKEDIKYLEITKRYTENDASGELTRKMCDVSIEAIKEVQQYREIGTVEELKQLKEILPYLKSCRQSLDDVVRKCNEYEKIGTVEECREAVEKQKPKAVTNGKLIKNFYGSPYCIKGDCPTCGRESIKSTDTDYCYVCGQHLKYDENLEGMEDEH